MAIFLIITDFLTGFGLEVGGIFLILLVLSLIFLWQVFVRPDRIERLIRWIKKRTGERKILDTFEREIGLFRGTGIQLVKRTLSEMPIIAALTAMIWLIDALVPSAILVGLGADPHYLFSITSQLILAIITLLPLTPGGVGVTELSMTYLYSMFVEKNLLGPLIILWRIITYFTNIAIGSAFAGASIGVGKKN